MEPELHGHGPWRVGSICVAALLATWASYFAVYLVLPAGTPLAHWGLLLLALGSTAGLIITLERVIAVAARHAASGSRKIV